MNIQLRNMLLLLASTMTVMAGATIAPSLPDMQKTFQHIEQAEMWVKLVMTIPGLIIAISAPFIGILLDRNSKTRIIFIATFLYGISGISGFFFEDSLFIILLGRALLGLAVAAIMVGCTSLISDYFQGAERGKYIGLQAAFGGFGGVIYLALGGYLADINWTMPFLIYGLAFLLLPAMMIYLKEPDKQAKLEVNHSNSIHYSKTLTYSCYFMATVEIFTLYMIPLHYPFYIQEIIDINATKTGLGIAFMLLIMAITSMSYQKLQSKMHYSLLHSFGLFLLASGYFIMAYASTHLLALTALLISGLGLGIMRPNLITWLLTQIPAQDRGKVLGTLTTFFFIGQFIGPLVTQPLVESVGYATMFLYTAIMILGFSSLYLLSWRINFFKNPIGHLSTDSPR